MLLFTYGTLQNKMPNNYALRASGAKFVKEHKLNVENFAMYECFGGNYPFPAILKNVCTSKIKGEIWEVPDFTLINRIEGYPHFYQKEKVEDFIIYFLPKKFHSFCNTSTPIFDWKSYILGKIYE